MRGTWFRFIIIIDKIRVSFSIVVILISFCVFSFACRYIREDVFKFRFGLILIIFVLSINILIFSGSIFLLLLGWDGLGISSFALIIYYHNVTRLNAGYLTLLTNRLGDVVIIITIPLILFVGYYNIYPLDTSYNFIIFFLCLAALTKRAQYPFRAWLPAAIAAPTPVRALVHSSTLVTAGVYLIIRISCNIPVRYNTAIVLLFCGATTCILGGVRAIYENDIKKIIAFSTLSQLGLIIFCLGMNIPMLALLHLYTHAIFKALLFLRAGLILIIGFGVQDLRLIGSVLYRAPIIVAFFNIRRLCLIGAPFVRAFYSKHVIYELIIIRNVNIFRVILICFGAILTRIYSVRTIKILGWGKINNQALLGPLLFRKHLPLIPLFLISVIRGKIFRLLEISNTVIMFTSTYTQMVLNLLLVLGVSFGLFFSNPKNSSVFSTMFFLWESSNKFIKYSQPVLLNIKVLDYGWLEPRNLLGKSFLQLGVYLRLLFKRLDNYLINLSRRLIICTIIFLICFFYW